MATTTMTQAQAFVGAQLDAGADGSAWSADLAAAAERAGARRRSVGYELARVEFTDGSAVALCGPGAAWDVAVGGGDCTCWVSAQRGAHHEDCSESGSDIGECADCGATTTAPGETHDCN